MPVPLLPCLQPLPPPGSPQVAFSKGLWRGLEAITGPGLRFRPHHPAPQGLGGGCMVPGVQSRLPLCSAGFTAVSPVPSHHPPPFSPGPKRRPGSPWRKGHARPSRPAWDPRTPWPPGKTPHLTAQPRGKGTFGFVSRAQPHASGVSRGGEAVSREDGSPTRSHHIRKKGQVLQASACQAHPRPLPLAMHHPRGQAGETWRLFCPCPAPSLGELSGNHRESVHVRSQKCRAVITALSATPKPVLGLS